MRVDQKTKEVTLTEIEYHELTNLQHEQPELTQVPHIEQETQKKGWMDYCLLISEIGLYRSNAIDRIKETKERAAEIKRNMAPHDLAILGEYLKSVGEEIVLCCLQRYCMDFMFTQDEVKEIIQQEQPEVDLEEYLSAKLFFLGADLVKHKPYSFNRGLNVGMTKAYDDILKKITARKEEKK